jgi:hypothetical protein
MKNAYKNFGRKILREERPLGICRCICEENIKMNLHETERMWIHLAQDRV